MDSKDPGSKSLVFILLTVVILTAIEVLIFVTSNPVGNHFTAGATVALAFATVWLGYQTREAVRANENEIDQNRELLSLTRKQADSAAIAAAAAQVQAEVSSKTFVASNRPFITLHPANSTFIEEFPDEIHVSFSLVNYGTGIALFERTAEPAKLTLYWNGSYLVEAFAESIVVPRDAYTVLSFVAQKSDVIRRGLPATRPDGSYTSALLEIRFLDTSQANRYQTIVSMETTTQTNYASPIVAELKVRDIKFDGPVVPLSLADSSSFDMSTTLATEQVTDQNSA